MATIDNTTFTWKIQNFLAYPTQDNFQNVIFSIIWEYNACYTESKEDTKLEYKTTRMGTTSVSTDNITNFVPYEDLTQEITVSWIGSQVNIPKMQQDMVKDLNNQISPPPPTIVVLPPPFPQ